MRNFFSIQITEKHRRMQLLENIYGGSTLWTKSRVTRAAKEQSSFFGLGSTPPKTIGLMFRTVKPDGILIYAATNKHYTSIEVSTKITTLNCMYTR